MILRITKMFLTTAGVIFILCAFTVIGITATQVHRDFNKFMAVFLASYAAVAAFSCGLCRKGKPSPISSADRGDAA